MLKTCSFLLALASVVSTSIAPAAAADRVVSYDPGVGYSQNFTHPDVVLGKPSTVNPYGEPTDVFDPPYGKDQILSIGTGGSALAGGLIPIGAKAATVVLGASKFAVGESMSRFRQHRQLEQRVLESQLKAGSVVAQRAQHYFASEAAGAA